jgi:hypothetical protein
MCPSETAGSAAAEAPASMHRLRQRLSYSRAAERITEFACALGQRGDSIGIDQKS